MRKIEEIRMRRAENAAARAKAEYDRTHAVDKWEAEYQEFIQKMRENKLKKMHENEVKLSNSNLLVDDETDLSDSVTKKEK